VIANANNQLQEAAEESGVEIPVMIISNPRNHSESTSINVKRIIEIQKKVLAITAINMRSPWLINEIEPNVAAVMGTFGVKTEALLDVIRGEFDPTGKLPFTIPTNQKVVNNDKGDIPGFRKAPSYVYRSENGDAYGYKFGLSYNEETNARTSIPDELKKV
jgi:beta-glucosidase